jgi:hypothetical protein
MHFSVGERLYRIVEIVDLVGTLYEVKVRPPVREDVFAGDTCEFDYPVCRVRLLTDDAMHVTHGLLKFSDQTLVFCEDWVQP